MKPDPIAPLLLRHEIFRRLHDEIIACVLQPGQELRENELAERFQISKSPIRDALLQLEFEGLIEVLPRRGYRVVDVSWHDAQELYEMRLLLERECTRRAIEHAPDIVLEQLAASAVMRPEDFRDFVSYNSRFHDELAAASGQGRLTAMTARVIAQFDRLIILSLSQLKALDLNGLEAEHLAIVAAMRARDAALADRLVSDHVLASRGRVEAALKLRASADGNTTA